MKNASSLKSNNINSPKTPGGISKSLLTPCRRVGLSRNWKNSGPSPFISPLSSASTDIKEKTETRKRKARVPEGNAEQTPDTCDENVVDTDNLNKTPSRIVDLPRRKKSKTIVSSINKSQEDIVSQSEFVNENFTKDKTEVDLPSIVTLTTAVEAEVSTPVRTKSKKSKTRSPTLNKRTPIEADIDSKSKSLECNKTTPKIELLPSEHCNKSASIVETVPSESNISTPIVQKNEEAIYTIKEKSPNDLSKECIVVIQRKIFKNGEKKYDSTDTQVTKSKIEKSALDSDSDEAPLINLHKQNSKSKSKSIIEDDEDFIDDKTTKVKPIKLKDTKSPKSKHKTKPLKTKVEKVVEKPSSQDCFDDEDDDFDNKKTILIRKSYDKVSKPLKAKSTGSITQRDIDNLRERIEAKKKLLLAQSLTPDTEELLTLIKKWQKGCQDALMELLDLMRNKFPDKERMDYSEMLRTLKIPPSLVGYDSENDCFNSPDDAAIILGQFKDL